MMPVTGVVPWRRPNYTRTPEGIRRWVAQQLATHKNEPLLACSCCGEHPVGELRFGTELRGRVVSTDELFFRLVCPDCDRGSPEATSIGFVAQEWNQMNKSWWERFCSFFEGTGCFGRLST